MKIEELTNRRVDDYLSQANKIPDDHRLIQSEVIDAKHVIKEGHEAMEHGRPVDWQSMDKAHQVMHRAYRHQPGERGSMTIGPKTLARRPNGER